MKTVKSKSSVNLHKSIELQYKNWTIRKFHSYDNFWTVYDEDGVSHGTAFRYIRSVEEAIEYIDEETSDVIPFK